MYDFKTISCLINSNKPFMITRTGMGVETVLAWCYVINMTNKHCSKTARKVSRSYVSNSGVYGSENFLINEFGKLYSNAIRNAEIHARWSHLINKETRCTPGANMHFCTQDEILSAYNFFRDKSYTGCSSGKLIHHRSLEPWMYANPPKESWTRYLADKSILVVSPFKNTIEKQYKVCNYLWGINSYIFCPKNMKLTVIKTPYTFVNRTLSWKHHLNDMKMRISRTSFDIAFLSCGAYGLPLANYIRYGLNKSSIYIGGGLQLWFGIIGTRWEKNKFIKRNKYWTKPLEIDSPPKNVQEKIEGRTYW